MTSRSRQTVPNCTVGKSQWWARLWRAFDRSAKHFRLSAASRKTAWESAQANPAKALACYTAIARSL